MEKDKLKAFITEHKEDFETDFPSANVWKGIEKATQPKSNRFSQRNLAQVVSIAAVLVLGLMIFNPSSEGSDDPIAEEHHSVQEEFSIASISNEMAEVESFYIHEVNSKLNLLEQYEVDEELMAEIEIMKEEYNDLKNEMKQSINPLEIIEMMIENYRLRLELLEGILQEFEQETQRAMGSKTRKNEMG